MKSVLKFLTSRLFLAFLGLLFVSLFIWFAGPLLGFGGSVPLASPINRLTVIGSLSGIFLITAVFRHLRARRNNAKVLDSLVDDTDGTGAASAEELATLQAKMQEAVDTLKSRNFKKSGGARYIYELPWYVIIGPPGAGKTTLLSNSGLDFPLEETHGKFSVKGVGGTRNCDWWFTDQAVLLDTAGRYTTQDSEASVDSSAWTGFLDLLRDKRKQRPINGVLVALSIQDILQEDHDTLIQTARTIRTRIEELYQRLGVAPPVYLMFTKCDLLAGFNEFFADLDSQGRAQTWGFTFPVDHPLDEPLPIRSNMAELSERLVQQSVGKLHSEQSQRNRDNVYGFPLQFNGAQQRIIDFAEQLTARSRLLENILFRGVYFTSATQTGSALDQVIHNVSASFGLANAASGSNVSAGKSFFINRLLREVVFREAGLAGTNLKTEARFKWFQRGAVAASALTLTGLLALWGSGYWQNRSNLSSVSSAADTVVQQAASLSDQSLDLTSTSQLLDSARALAFNGADGTRGSRGFLTRRTGLFQGDKVDDFANSKYEELLIDALLPRLMVRLENQMHAQNDNSEFIFEALKTYLMLDDREHYDSDAVIGWFNFDFDSNLPTDTPNTLRASLKQHVATLFREKPFRLPRPLDSSLVAQYRQLAASTSIEERAYNRIRASTARSGNAFVRLTELAGNEIPRVFTRADGVSLDQSIPRLFSLDGYTQSFLPASANIANTLADDTWVLGDALPPDQQSLSPEQLQVFVTNRYYDDYIDTWDGLIDALELKSVEGLQGASDLIALITDAQSPLKDLLVAVADQTLLTKPQDPTAAATDGTAATSRENELGSLLGGSTEATAAGPATLDPVSVHFAPLHKLVENVETNASPLDTVLLQMADVNLQLLPMAQSPGGSIDPQLSQELAINLQKLGTKADRLPQPMASLLTDLSGDISDIAGGGFCQQLNSAWQTEVHAYYNRAIRNRYPVNRQGSADIALSDFGAFFGPGGLVDNFVNTYLSSLVSKTPGQWTWTGTGSSVCLSDNSLKQLALADDIKNTFFSLNPQLPSFRFDVVPSTLNMSLDIDNLILDVGGTRLEYFHGPVTGSTSFTWPSVNNNTQVSLRAEPVVPGSSSSVSASGPWAILRLFDQANRTRTRSGLQVAYSFAGRPVSMELATSSFNPLNSVALRNFRSPENL